VVGRWFVLRLAGIYGPGRHHLLNALRAGTTRFTGAPEIHQNLAHRDDIVSAALACLAAPASVRNEIFNVSDDTPPTRAELLGWLAAELKLPAPEFEGPAANQRRGGEPSPDRRIRAEKVCRMLGWQPSYPDYRAGYRAILAAESTER
jgi:nucleoside-diphosphate-sugar epimerase